MTGIARSGRFITLEGGEGAGKSTQARLLAAWLEQRGLPVEITREPGGSAGAEQIRGLLVTGEPGRWEPLTETLLHCAARRDHVIARLIPAVEAGKWVLSDRFFDSTLAYQGYGQGVDFETIARLRAMTVGAFEPDLTFILDVSPETRRARTLGRRGGEDRYERMTEAFHDRVRNGFRAIALAEAGRCVTIDAERPADDVAAAIQAEILRRFPHPSRTSAEDP